MKVIGLTGGIGSGKSTAAEYLKNKGFAHIDADQIGRDITKDGSPILKILNDNFGPDARYGKPGVSILDENGSLLRKELAGIVFADQTKRERLDEIMLTEIIAEIDRMIENFRSEGQVDYVLLDAPTLFEAGLKNRCDKVVLITAEIDVRIKRVSSRDGLSEEAIRDRINNQLSDDAKASMSDFVVDNSNSLEDLYRQLDEVCNSL